MIEEVREWQTIRKREEWRVHRGTGGRSLRARCQRTVDLDILDRRCTHAYDLNPDNGPD